MSFPINRARHPGFLFLELPHRLEFVEFFLVSMQNAGVTDTEVILFAAILLLADPNIV